jgi:hypothetical protein
LRFKRDANYAGMRHLGGGGFRSKRDQGRHTADRNQNRAGNRKADPRESTPFRIQEPSAHFSRLHRETFGVTPSYILGRLARAAMAAPESPR